MERKDILKLVVAIIVLALIAILPLKVLFMDTATNLRLLASGIILSIVLGGYNMIKSLFGSAEAEELKKANILKEKELDKKDMELEKLEKANKLAEQQLESLKKQMKKDSVIEMIGEFLSPLISNLEGKIEEVDRYLGDDKRLKLTLIRPDYEYAHILGDENRKWIKEKVDEYNDLVRDEELEKARETAIELKNSLEELKNKLLEKYSISRKDVEKKAHTPMVIREKKRTKEGEK